MHKYLFWIISFLFVLWLPAKGQQVTSTEAVTAAINIMSLESKFNQTLDSVDNTYAIVNNGDSLLFEVHFINGSSVLLSGHKSCTPILGLLLAEEDEPSQGIFNRLDSLSPALHDLLEYYSTHLQYAIDNNLPAYYESVWDSLLNYNDTTANTQNVRDKVPPLLKTKWGQWKSNDGGIMCAYNYNIPGCNNYKHCCTGCVATAMAQVLKYWGEPKDIPSRCDQFDWNNMTNKLNYNHNNDYTTQRDAISTLMLDCGTIVDMKYCGGLYHCNTQESSAYLHVAPDSLKKYGYNNAYYASKNDYSETQWGNMLRSNLANGYPLLYRGQYSETSQHGHCFVCDGYKKKWFSQEYLYHINWGRNGEGNAWFTLDNLLPENQLSSYSYKQAAVFDNYPSACWENIIMECSRSFSSGTVKAYFTSGKFNNNSFNYHICNGATVLLFAGDEILLTDGFYAEEDSYFQSVIIDCSTVSSIPPDYIINSKAGVISADTLLSPKSLQQPAPFADNATLKVYPNPATNTLHVEFEGTDDPQGTLTVTDLTGVVVLTRECHEPVTRLDVSHLTPGLYVVSFRNAEGVVVRKFVKM